jgi:hypothetical protein
VDAPRNRLVLPVLPARPATHAEVARIQGEAYLRLAHWVGPENRAAYVQNAQEVLQGAVDAGEVDPAIRLLLAFVADEDGDTARATEALERAVADGIPRPYAYQWLAQLRLNRYLAERGGDPLTPADTAGVRDLLRQADAMRPRLAGTYTLALGLWAHSAVPPAPEDLAMLAAGVEAFPSEPKLMRDTLELFAKSGAAANPELAVRMQAWRQRLGQ